MIAVDFRLRRSVWALAAMALVASCALPPRPVVQERPLEERAGLTPARGQVPLEDGRFIPVRFRVADALYAFFVVPGPRLSAWAKREGAMLDVERGAIVRAGHPPILLANARDLARLMPGPQNAWLFSAELDLWASLEGGVRAERIETEDIAELEPGLPWHALRLELDEAGEGIDIEVDVGGAYWRLLMNETDELGPLRFTFDARRELLIRSPKLERVRDATLGALSELPAGSVLLENMQGLSIDPGPLLRWHEAESLFTAVTRLEGVPWDIVDDGCGERAMIASSFLADRGVRAVKVFVVGDLELPGEERAVEWSFHVAPAVFVESVDGIEVIVFDPAIERAPLPLVEWLGRFVTGPIVVDVLPWWQRNAVEWGGFEREADAPTNLERAREALEEVIVEWHQEKAARALETAAVERAQWLGGQRPALSN